MFCCMTERDIFRKVKSFAPIDDLAVGVMRVFGAEGRPADETFEHDGSDGPPVTAERIAFAGEDLGCDVVGGSDGGVGHDAT